MPDHALQDLKGTEVVAPKRFDLRSATPFVNKSVSEETRRAYRKAVSDFFLFLGGKHPSESFLLMCRFGEIICARKGSARLQWLLSWLWFALSSNT